MAKASKMNRGISSKEIRGGKTLVLPPGIHSIDNSGNIFASFPEIARVFPKYFLFEEIEQAFKEGKLLNFSAENLEILKQQVKDAANKN